MLRTLKTRLSTSRRIPGSLLALLLASAGMASAAEADPGTSQGWKFTIAPYIWGAALEGDITVKGQDAEVDLSASDIFDHMDLGAMAMFAARKGNWGITGDVVWVDLQAESDAPPADIDPKLGIFTLQAVRRLSKVADLTFGARYHRLEAEIDFDAPIDVQVGNTRDWVDPVVGVVLRTPGEHRWHATLIADVGGFGAGSDLAWQFFPSVGFDMAKWVSIEVGYRFLGTDYETGEGADRFAYDMLYQGPAVGVAFRF
jgi:hypothetical protein